MTTPPIRQICAVAGCAAVRRVYTGRGRRPLYCEAHHRTWRGLCSVPGCDLRREQDGLCGMHFYRMRTHGSLDPLRTPSRVTRT